jgi:hypothetical protein
VQLIPDGHNPYLDAVEGAFGGDIDYAMLVKLYGPSSDGAKAAYSPAECIGARKEPVMGRPDPKHISTSFAERQNLNMRMLCATTRASVLVRGVRTLRVIRRGMPSLH